MMSVTCLPAMPNIPCNGCLGNWLAVWMAAELPSCPPACLLTPSCGPTAPLSPACRYRECLDHVDRLDLTISPSNAGASSFLILLYGTDGDQHGGFQKTVTVQEGYSTTHNVDIQLSSTVSTQRGS